MVTVLLFISLGKPRSPVKLEMVNYYHVLLHTHLLDYLRAGTRSPLVGLTLRAIVYGTEDLM